MEKIISIEDVTFGDGRYSGYDGIRITTDSSVYEVGISNEQSCCEDWGYIFNEDGNDKDFVGSNLISVDSDGTFTRFHTDKGTLDFTAYNEHNGYYSHHAVLKKNGEIVEDVYI